MTDFLINAWPGLVAGLSIGYLIGSLIRRRKTN